MRAAGPTIRDVAVQAEVSIGTVSRVLNRYPDVDPKLRERVEGVVRQLGYRMNERTRSVVHTKSRMVGLILCNDFGLSAGESLLLLGVEEFCTEAGYYLLFARHRSLGDTPAAHLSLPAVIGTPGLADCLILAGNVGRNMLNAFDDQGLNYVLLANHLRDLATDQLKASYVAYDDEGGSYAATKYLAQLGHTDIWYVGDQSRPWHRQRYQGYARAMNELSLELHVHTIALSDDEFENGQAAVVHILDQGWPVTAVLAASGDLAFGVREGLRQHRREVPRDVSLVGFEDQPKYSRGSNLTSVSLDLVEVGKQLAKLAVSRIEDSDGEKVRVTVPSALTKRSSCRPLRREEHMLL